MGRPALYKTDEERRIARNAYMRKYKSSRRDAGLHEPSPNRNDASYDPQRDGPALILSLTALICGDPPLGRSALDRQTSGSK